VAEGSAPVAAAGKATPRSLGRYEILRHLASGGMAEVLLARASGIEGFVRHVVIKRIHPDQAGDKAFVEMFLDEARLAATLHHHHIVQVYDIGQEAGEYFFAMEYVHGEDLSRLLAGVAKKREKVPLDHCATIVTCACAALHYAHDQRGADGRPLGIVHRDISPQNILVGYDGNVKVVDFGIAKAAMRSQETRSGTLKGKVSYMSPEQCTGKAIDRRSDVFALGIVLYELVTAKRLFRGETDFNTMSAIVSGVIPPPSEHRPDLPPALEAIIMQALARSPAERYQTADELRIALEAYAIAAGLRSSTTALADYIKLQFGSRPEPWLPEAAAAAASEERGEDPGSGVARAPTGALDEFAPSPSVPSVAPIVRARNKEITRPPPDGAYRQPLATPAPALAVVQPPITATGTPMAWTTTEPPAAASSSRPVVILGIAAIVAAAGVAIVFRLSGGSSGGRGAVPPPRPAAHVVQMPVVATPPPAPPPPPPVAVVVAADAGVAAAPPDAEVPKAKPLPAGKPVAQPPKKKWNSDQLFPE
jgi:serine/threonine-protein kinase